MLIDYVNVELLPERMRARQGMGSACRHWHAEIGTGAEDRLRTARLQWRLAPLPGFP
ncbi:MAG: hypothetical protein JST22_03435 [Bacteroidetes bacterium]|nr:hypothetical protein [Bacteroidota bacterium]